MSIHGFSALQAFPGALAPLRYECCSATARKRDGEYAPGDADGPNRVCLAHAPAWLSAVAHGVPILSLSRWKSQGLDVGPGSPADRPDPAVAWLQITRVPLGLRHRAPS